MEEYERATAAPLRVVALGRSGVGKSHVLNALLRELASRGDARGRIGRGGQNGKLTLTKMGWATAAQGHSSLTLTLMR